MKSETKVLNEGLAKIGLELPPNNMDKLLAFIDILLQKNQVVNLTSITDYTEALIKHLYDSLIILTLPQFKVAKTILDIGSGAGIPVIPLAICSPGQKFVSIDSTQKKINFQAETCQKLQIENCLPVWARAEDFARQPNRREQFDLVLARAVAATNVLVELTIPFAKVNGTIIYYKGKEYAQELQQAEQAIKRLGGVVENITVTELPADYGTRSLICLKKIKPTPLEFPRKVGIPLKKPL